MNMLILRGQIKLAQDGVGLLKGKRDALMQELISRARQLATMRDELFDRGKAAEESIVMARAVCGTPELRSAAVATRRDLDIVVRSEKVWGLGLGAIELAGISRRTDERGLSLLGTPSHIHESSQTSEHMLEQLLRCAPLERNLQIIGEEVKKVSRRINALEEYVLPTLRGQVTAIASKLDEREREDTFRLKKIKSKKAAVKRKKAQAAMEVQ
jgi:V/A-type H+-transporting ATPase subunit D